MSRGLSVIELPHSGAVLVRGYLINPGDWLQLCAASAWLLANIAAVMTAKVD